MSATVTERLKTPLLYPCAARVKMPQIGSEDSDLKLGQKTNRYAPETIVFRATDEPKTPISKNYLKKVSTDLKFEEDVVKERCYHALPYDEKYMYEAFDITGLVELPAKTRIPVGRYNSRGSDNRHMPCNLTKSTKSTLKPLRRKITERAQQMHYEALKREQLREIQTRIIEKHRALEREGIDEDERESKSEDDEGKDGFFITQTKQKTAPKPGVEEKPSTTERKVPPLPLETPTAVRKASVTKSQGKTAAELLAEDEDKKEQKEKTGNDWDSYVMSLVSKNTANWIVYEKTPSGTHDREKLETLLKQWYGAPEHTDLVRDVVSDTEMEAEDVEKRPKKKWKKKEATLLQRVYNLEEDKPQALDPYSDDNRAPFYRQPAGLRRARKHEVKEELVSRMKGAINTTAANIEVAPYKLPPPPSLRDFLNPAVGSTIVETDNMFQQEQLTGREQLYQAFGDKQKIVMETNNKYKKELQPGFPKLPETWFPATDAEKQESAREVKKLRKRERGLRRWKQLPQPIDDTSDLLKIQAPGMDNFQKSADPRTRKTAKNNASLLQIIDEWRTKWHLSGQYVDSTPEDLIHDMADIQPHVRLKAIATCAKASDYKPPEDDGIQLEFMERETENRLPEKLFVALECLLEDAVDKVRTAAAITLYSLNRPSKQAEGILYTALESQTSVDRWAAAQCLAHYGVCDSDVISEILKQVMNTEDTIKHERGISMLGVLSISSNLVHCMVAEQLNSSSWRHKVIACKILPTLSGDINKDITNKLSDLMWNDWHSEVRRAAAQCLGKTGHGRDVHDNLREKMLEGDERTRMEALNKIGQLGIMTAKLLPAFLLCFEDEYVAIRSEACITSGNLAVKDEEVIAKLINLATFDTIWKIKALAFQALGKIGQITEQIVDCLLWAVRYEENAGVRAEACHTLQVLQVRTEEVADVLQDRFLVEGNKLVRDELASTLRMFDISASEDMDMVAQIKREVKKLCTRNIIATQITLNEADDDKRDNLKRMIYESEKDMKQYQVQQEPMMDRIRSLSRVSSHRSEPQSGRETPEPIRDVVFTPTAEQELEAILGREELESGRTSPTSTQGTTPATKSRPTTTSTMATTPGNEDDEEEEETEGSEKEGEKSPCKSGEEEHQPSSGSRSPGTKSEEEVEGEIARVTQELERPTSTVKFASHLEVADIPNRSRSSLGPSRLSLMDEHGRPSRTGTMMTGTTGTEGMVFGRDAVVEREKINEEARNTFAVMDGWYQDMLQDLIDLDNAFELGLSADSRQEFEEKIQKVRVSKTPPTSKDGMAKVEVSVTDTSEGQGQQMDSDKQTKVTENANISSTKLEEQTADDSGNVIDPPNDRNVTESPTVDREKTDIEIIVTEDTDTECVE
ncbi:HEAT repeat-containing protein 4-like isoform X2 [Mya arenaria]|uniref:HEAT repeat-containing protein 4-like isoform X2 n=1 Tax=Mya arenaria TaxID=6604 RepID=UPI0022E69A29|nr:HEAT repeat-containing protein 4-like isoform X2 [Mya arenaria]